MAMSNNPRMSIWRRFTRKLCKQRAQFSLKCLFDQFPRPGPDQVRERISRKSGWSRQGGNGIFSHVAYPFLCEN